MAKTKIGKKKLTVGARAGVAARGLVRKVRSVSKGITDSATLDVKAAAAASMLMDPCNATISEACYRGDRGYRNRFVTNFSLGTSAGQTACAVYFSPTTNQFGFVATPASSSAGTWSVTAGPGNTFLSVNTTAIRSLGACISATPISANLATSGQVYTTICPLSSLPGNGAAGSAITIDAILQLCNKYGKVQIDEPMESKWVPASSDEDYSPLTGSTDVSDTNIILMIFVGLPAASGLVCRFTNIIEWKPQASIGIVSESYQGNPSRNTIEHVKTALHKRNPNWWSNVGKGVYSVIRGYATGGSIGAISAAMGAVKFM